MAKFEIVDLTPNAIGRESRQPESVGAAEPQLSSRVRPLLADDEPHPRRPAGEVDDAGGIDDPGTIADLLVGIDSI